MSSPTACEESREGTESGMRQRRVILTVLTAVLIMISVSFTAHAEEGGVVTYTGEGGAFELVSGDSLNFHFTCKLDFDWFVYGDNTMYLSDLGQFAVTAANAIYVSGTSAASGSIPGGGTSFFTSVGFDAAESITVASETGYDKNDFTGFIAAHKKVEREGKTYEIIFITLRGSLTTEEWQSNFDIGADTETYYSVTGEHPEWLDSQKCLHKGFAVTANRVMKAIAEYEARVLDPEAEKIIMLTGHSRGGSIANILGTFYEDDSSVKSFTYTIAAANTAVISADVAASYTTIFNLQNSDDFVPLVPSYEWGGFRLYGTNLSADAANYSTLHTTVTGEAYTSAGGSSMASTIASFASSRAGLYEINTTDDSFKVEKTGHLSQSDAQSDVNSLISSLSGIGLRDYVDFSIETYRPWYNLFEDHYRAVVYYCPVYLIELGLYLMNGKSSTEMLTAVFTYPISASHKTTAMANSTTFIGTNNKNPASYAHNTAAYYCIASANFDDQYNPGQEKVFLPEGSLPYLNRYISELNPEVTYTDECWAKIEKALNMYNALSAEQKGRVVNFDKIQTMVVSYLNLYIADLNATVTNTDECWAKIRKAKDMYGVLSADQKATVVNYSKIETMEVNYLNLYISDLDPEVTDSEAYRANIKKAKDIYEALSENQKSNVSDYEKIETMEMNLYIFELDTTVTYTEECWAKIETGLQMYEALSAEQKVGVINYEKIETAEADFYGLNDTKNASTQELLIYSRCKGSDMSVANITGGGLYEPIAGGKITAPAQTDGFTFVGWYTGYTADSIGTLFSDKTTVRVKPTEKTSLTAVYEPKADTTFTVEVTADNYTAAYGSELKESQAGTNSYSVTPGTVLTVTYTAEDKVPVFWQDSNGTIVGRGDVLTIPVTGDSAVTVFTIPKSAASFSAYVRFLDAEGNTLTCEVCTSFQTITFPEAPEVENMTFKRWSMTEAEIQAEMAAATAKPSEVIVSPVYEAKP